MTYARARLWLGITGVGSWVLLSLAGLVWQWGFLWPSNGIAIDLALWLVLYAFIQLPFDLLGGVVAPNHYGRPQTSLRLLARGIASQLVLWWLAALAVFQAGHRFGLFGALVVALLSMLLLLAAQVVVARLVGHLQSVSHDGPVSWDGAVRLVRVADPAFVGGWVGLGPTRSLILPVQWSAHTRSVQLLRRQAVLQSGSRAAGLFVAIAFNLAGFALVARFLPGAGFANSGEFLHLVFGFTLWSFLGLLLLPSVSRPAVFLADRFAEEQGSDWKAVARHLDQLQDDEPARSPWVERIFHPVPALQRRLALPPPRWGAWHAARMALYLSWAVPGLLARSVHCNVGRPDLWVLFPGD